MVNTHQSPRIPTGTPFFKAPLGQIATLRVSRTKTLKLNSPALSQDKMGEGNSLLLGR